MKMPNGLDHHLIFRDTKELRVL
jgi:hypothetical protein